MYSLMVMAQGMRMALLDLTDPTKRGQERIYIFVIAVQLR